MGKRIDIEHGDFRLAFIQREVSDRTPFPDCRYFTLVGLHNGGRQRVYLNSRTSALMWEPVAGGFGEVEVKKAKGVSRAEFIRSVLTDADFGFSRSVASVTAPDEKH